MILITEATDLTAVLLAIETPVSEAELRAMLVAWSDHLDENPETALWPLIEFAEAYGFDSLSDSQLLGIQNIILDVDPDVEAADREQDRDIRRARMQALLDAGFTMDGLLSAAVRLYIDESAHVDDLGSTIAELAEAVMRG